MKGLGFLTSLVHTLLLQKTDTARVVHITDLHEKLRVCNPHKKPHLEALFSYKDPLIRDLIWSYKYGKNKKIADLFGEYLYEHLLGTLGEEAYMRDETNILLVPIPISLWRYAERGFNQSSRLVDVICSRDKEQLFQKATLLKKVGASKHQARTKNRRDRRKNVKGVFRLKKEVDLRKTHIVIVDDVITTSATIEEARQVLLKAGAKKVSGLSIAY